MTTKRRLIEQMWRSGYIRPHRSGVGRIRTGFPLSRRSFLQATAAVAAAPLVARSELAFPATGVRFLGWQGYEEGLTAGGIDEKLGLRIDATYMNDNNQIITRATRGGMGAMDIVTPDHGYTPVMANIGILQPLDVDRIPNFSNLFPFFRTVPGPRVEGTQYALPYTWGSIPLMFRPDEVDSPPTSWLDMLKPEYKGRVALVNDVISVMIPFAMAATGTTTPTQLNREELRETVDLLIRIKRDHARTIASSYGELADLFATGEIVMAQAWEPVAAWAGAKGANLDWTIPHEGTWTLIDNLALIKDAPHQEDAYKLLNNGLTPGAQAHVANENHTGVTVSAAVELLDDKPRSMYPYDDIEGFFSRASHAGGPFSLWPFEPSGDLVTFQDVLNGWDRFLKA